jgi:hypothetical protein
MGFQAAVMLAGISGEKNIPGSDISKSDGLKRVKNAKRVA